MVTRNQVDSAGTDEAVFTNKSSEKGERKNFFADPPLSPEARLDEKVSKASQDVIEASLREAQRRVAMEQLAQLFGGGSAAAGAAPQRSSGLGGTPGGLVEVLNNLNTPLGARLT